MRTVRGLKHYGFRLWATLVFGGVICLRILPVLQPRIPYDWIPAPVAFLLILTFLLIGWLADRAGLSYATRKMQEAAAWEREAMLPQAEKAYKRAAAVFDSFLMSPRMVRSRARELSARMARFYIARAEKSRASEIFLSRYLNACPDDREVAEYWLQQLGAGRELKESDEETAARIGVHLPDSPQVQQSLAGLYLGQSRTDFTALQTYRRALAAGTKNDHRLISGLADLFLREGRADEWALEIYLEALRRNSGRRDLISGIAAGRYWVKPTEQSRTLVKKADQVLAGFSAEHLDSMRSGFQPPQPPADKRRPPLAAHLLQRFGGSAAAGRRAAAFWVKNGLQQTGSRLLRWLMFCRRSAAARKILKWTITACAAAAVAFFAANTLQHLTHTPQPPAPAKKTLMPVVKDRFTIQVAAYLQRKHAEQYVAELKKQGLDAYWKAARGSKRSWYQVRVSHFPDKAAARGYGEKLKSQGIIEDFYVANYTYP